MYPNESRHGDMQEQGWAWRICNPESGGFCGDAGKKWGSGGLKDSPIHWGLGLQLTEQNINCSDAEHPQYQSCAARIVSRVQLPVYQQD